MKYQDDCSFGHRRGSQKTPKDEIRIYHMYVIGVCPDSNSHYGRVIIAHLCLHGLFQGWTWMTVIRHVL